MAPPCPYQTLNTIFGITNIVFLLLSVNENIKNAMSRSLRSRRIEENDAVYSLACGQDRLALQAISPLLTASVDSAVCIDGNMNCMQGSARYLLAGHSQFCFALIYRNIHSTI